MITVILAVLFQEAVRGCFTLVYVASSPTHTTATLQPHNPLSLCSRYSRTEKGVKAITPDDSPMPLNDLASAIGTATAHTQPPPPHIDRMLCCLLDQRRESALGAFRVSSCMAACWQQRQGLGHCTVTLAPPCPSMSSQVPSCADTLCCFCGRLDPPPCVLSQLCSPSSLCLFTLRQ